MATRVIPHKKHRIEIDTASLHLGLAMPKPKAFGRNREPEIVATPRDGRWSSGFVSASSLALKCKRVDDRLYAAVEHAAQGGSSGKRELLLALGRRLAAQSPDGGAAPEVILAAASLGGIAHQLEGALGERVSKRIAEFLADPLASKPIGFYTDSDELTAIFQQDRMLQTPLRSQDAALVARELHAERPAARPRPEFRGCPIERYIDAATVRGHRSPARPPAPPLRSAQTTAARQGSLRQGSPWGNPTSRQDRR